MPTLKNFLDRDGLIKLLLNIEQLDETNIKDVYWSTDNADLLPTVMFKVGDDNGSAHTTKKITFKGDTTSPAPSGTTARTLTITIGGVDKTITYYDTNNTDEKVSQTSDTSSSSYIPLLIASGATPSTDGAKYNSNLKFKPSTNELVVEGSTTANNTTTSHTISLKDGVVTITSGSTSSTLSASEYSGNAATATKATLDGSGNVITTTYATKSALEEIALKWTGLFVVLKSSPNTDPTYPQYVALTNIITAIAGGTTPSSTDLDELDFGYIYLLNDTNASSPNIFDEYIKVQTGSSTQTVEKIGTTDAGIDVVSIPATGTNSVASLWETYVTNA